MEEYVKEGKMDKSDVSKQEDLFWAICDVYALEKHLISSINKMIRDKVEKKITTNTMKIYRDTRKIRALLLKRLTKNTKYDFWCLSKHFVGAVMQISEVAAKELQQGNEDEAYKLFSISDDLYIAFWLIQEMKYMFENKKEG